MTRIELGAEGEKMAFDLLVSKGLEIVERNYKWGKGELDIICKDHATLIVVEVKTRQTSYFGEPYMAVSKSKQRQIVKITNQYIKCNSVDLDVRFDVISIILNSKRKEVEHIENAFIPLV